MAARYSEKRKIIRSVLRKMEKIDLISEQEAARYLEQITSFQDLGNIVKILMDKNEDKTIKGLDLVFAHPFLRKQFTKAELDDYILFADELYKTEIPRYNPLRQILQNYRYPFPEEKE